MGCSGIAPLYMLVVNNPNLRFLVLKSVYFKEKFKQICLKIFDENYGLEAASVQVFAYRLHVGTPPVKSLPTTMNTAPPTGK